MGQRRSRPVLGGDGGAHCLARRDHLTGNGQTDHARPCPQRPCRHQQRRPAHARRPRDDEHGGVPLVGVALAGTDVEDDVGAFDDPGPRERRGVEADAGQDHLPGELRTPPEEQTRLERGEGDRDVGAHRGGPFPHCTGEPVEPRRDVDGQHLCSAGAGGDERAVEARSEGPVDDQVASWDARCENRVARYPDDVDAHPPSLQQFRGNPGVGAVVARAGQHHHPPPVRSAQHRDGLPGDGMAGGTDQDIERMGRSGIHRPHLLRTEDGDHRVILAQGPACHGTAGQRSDAITPSSRAGSRGGGGGVSRRAGRLRPRPWRWRRSRCG